MSNTARRLVFLGTQAEPCLIHEEVPIPKLKPGEILGKLRMATICGSDLHTISGKRKEQTPRYNLKCYFIARYCWLNKWIFGFFHPPFLKSIFLWGEGKGKRWKLERRFFFPYVYWSYKENGSLGGGGGLVDMGRYLSSKDSNVHTQNKYWANMQIIVNFLQIQIFKGSFFIKGRTVNIHVCERITPNFQTYVFNVCLDQENN